MTNSARAVGALLLFASLCCWAGGDMGSDDHDDALLFFGFVQDSRGIAIRDARVSASLKAGVTYVTRTNAVGVYRFTNFGKQTNPDDVLIACAKDGYKQIRVTRRPLVKGDTSKPIQTDCRLERG